MRAVRRRGWSPSRKPIPDRQFLLSACEMSCPPRLPARPRVRIFRAPLRATPQSIGARAHPRFGSWLRLRVSRFDRTIRAAGRPAGPSAPHLRRVAPNPARSLFQGPMSHQSPPPPGLSGQANSFASVFVRRFYFYIVECCAFATIRKSGDLNLVSGAQRHRRESDSRAGIGVRFIVGQSIVGNPGADLLPVEKRFKMRRTVPLIKILNTNAIPTGLSIKVRRCCTLRLFAENRFAARRVFLRCDRSRRITIERHGFCFDASRMISNASRGIGNMRFAPEPIAYRVAPDNRVASLIVELLQHGLVTLFIDSSAQPAPFFREGLRFRGALVMRIVNILNHCFPG